MASSTVYSSAIRLGSFLVEEVKYLDEVTDKIESLQLDLLKIGRFVRDVDTLQHQEKVMYLCLSRARDLAYEVEDVIERYLHEASHFQPFITKYMASWESINRRSYNIWNTLRYRFPCMLYTQDAHTMPNLGPKTDNLRVKITELTSRLQTYIKMIKPEESLVNNTMNYNERMISSGDYKEVIEDVVGLEKDVQKVVDQLVNTDVKVIRLIGTSGSGKTTLARKVFLDESVRKHFNNTCVWFYLSKELDMVRVFQETSIGHDKDEDARRKTEELTLSDLHTSISKLLRDENCFLVLDNMWSVDAWKSLQTAFASIESTHSKILLTTRNEGLLQHFDSKEYSHRLTPLSHWDSWKLLRLKTFQQGWRFPDALPERLMSEMLDHCHGLPSAIIALGGILLTKTTVHELQSMRANLASYHVTTGVNLELGIIYHDLPFHWKQCFLYLANFPESYDISTQKLYQLWQANGLLMASLSAGFQRNTTYELGEMCLNELVKRYMVEVVERWPRPSRRIKSCRVHNHMRDLCATTLAHLGEKYVGFTESKKLHQILAADSCSGQQIGKVAYLRSLVSFGRKVAETKFSLKILRSIGKSLLFLRVLDLEGIRIRNACPKEVGQLIHLRYLSLRNTWIQALPLCFWDLEFMETLDLRTSQKMLLFNKFYKMKRLNHLYLPEWYVIAGEEKLNFPNHQMETLTNFHPSKCQIKSLLDMKILKVLSIADDYVFSSRDTLRVLLNSPAMKPDQLFNSLALRIKAEVLNEDPNILSNDKLCFDALHIQGPFEGPWYNIHTALETLATQRHLKSLYLKYCEVDEELIRKLKNVSSLELLCIEEPTMISSKISFPAKSFPELNKLYLYSLQELEELDVGEQALCSLRYLKLHACEKLKKIGLPSVIKIEGWN